LTLPAPTGAAALRAIPHCGIAPIATDIAFLRDTLGFARRVQARCGPLARGMLFARDQVLGFSAEASEAALFDRAGAFSARGGWQPLLGELFPGGLILRDGAEHREHRRLMLPALRRDELAAHLARMAPRIESAVDGWLAAGGVELHHAVKTLTLDIATDVFIGARLRDEVAALNRDFVALVDASAAILRLPIPLTRYTRGRQARTRLVAFLRARLAGLRDGRVEPGGDLLSRLAALAAAEPDTIRDAELVDHLVFLWMAAHDTTASAVTHAVGLLADHPAWQARVRDEAIALGDDAPTLESLQRQTEANAVLRETLRLFPPIPTLSRQATAPVELHDQLLPAGTMLTVFPLAVQRDARWWPDPDRFDPARFAPGNSDGSRHPFAWSPFGGGAHACLGQHFAMMQATAILRALLRRSRVERAGCVRPATRLAPIAHPVPGLSLRVLPLAVIRAS
jgi:cytochrome P450